GILLHEHKSLGLWLQPGGHIEPGEWPQDAARREGEEETGLFLSHPTNGPLLIRIDVHPGPRGHTHLDFGYLLLAQGGVPVPPTGESQQVAWFSLVDALERAAEDLKEFLPSLVLSAQSVGVSIPESSSSA
ncbi:MAG: NUDIX domain-containing protein, partial [Actinomycetota bacterium]